MTATDLEWQPRTLSEHVLVDPTPVAALASIFDDGLLPPQRGEPLPALWHWAALPTWSPASLISGDGHPVRGAFLPPIDLPRRMFAGGEVSFYSDVPVGALVRREATVTSVDRKHGRSGELAVVSVETNLFDADTLCITERQDIIYRAAVPLTGGADLPEPPTTLGPSGPPLRRSSTDSWALRTDPTMLMRFSAATSNAHRIHYDWPYATRIEGYPGLVVHGPLMTLALAEIARLEGVNTVGNLTHRNLAPLFCGEPATCRRSIPTSSATTFELFKGDSICSTLTLWEGDHTHQKGHDDA